LNFEKAALKKANKKERKGGIRLIKFKEMETEK
jgi:hypothetical protein